MYELLNIVVWNTICLVNKQMPTIARNVVELGVFKCKKEKM